MLYRHVFDKISTEFRGISRVFVNFAALLLLKISEALYLKGLCQLESMRSEVMQITFNCQNSIVFNA